MSDNSQPDPEEVEVDFWVDAEPDDAGPGTRGPARPRPVSVDKFLFDGRAMTAEEFSAHVEVYDIGPVPPDYIIIHHTDIPYTVRTLPRNPAGWVWDSKEAGLSEEQIKAKRLRQLVGMREFYRTNPNLHWDRGPHLFIDDRYIYLFTPMFHTGIHAGEGNDYRDANGYHYSIGIEVIGSYDSQQWPEETARLVGHAVAVMRRKWKTFEIVHKKKAGGVSMHRDYPTPKSCPGHAITPQYIIGVLHEGAERLNAAATFSADSPLLGPPSGSREQAARYLKRILPAGHEYTPFDVDVILGHYWSAAQAAGVDPFLAVVQSIHETNGWQSPEAARPHRNPAKLGQGGAPGGFQSFPTWEESSRAHVALLREQGQGGRRLRDLRGQEYAHALLARAQEIARG